MLYDQSLRLASLVLIFSLISIAANTALAQLSEHESEIDAEIQATWSQFLAEIGRNNAKGAADLLRPSIRAEYLEQFSAMGDKLYQMSDGWSEIKAVQLTETLSEYTLFDGDGEERRMYFVTFGKGAEGKWLILTL